MFNALLNENLKKNIARIGKKIDDHGIRFFNTY